MVLRAKLSYQGARARAFGKRRGNDWIRAHIWNWEYRTGKWDHIEGNPVTTIYEMMTRLHRTGRVLDLGCGAGAVRCNLPVGAMSGYVGVDISPAAIDRAKVRAATLPRLPEGQSFVVGSITDPATQRRAGTGFDVILFNECVNYIPVPQLPGVLVELSPRLSDEGVFIFRVHDRERWSGHISAIRKTLRVIDDRPSATSEAITLAAVPADRLV